MEQRVSIRVALEPGRVRDRRPLPGEARVRRRTGAHRTRSRPGPIRRRVHRLLASSREDRLGQLQIRRRRDLEGQPGHRDERHRDPEPLAQRGLVGRVAERERLLEHRPAEGLRSRGREDLSAIQGLDRSSRDPHALDRVDRPAVAPPPRPRARPRRAPRASPRASRAAAPRRGSRRRRPPRARARPTPRRTDSERVSPPATTRARPPTSPHRRLVRRAARAVPRTAFRARGPAARRVERPDEQRPPRQRAPGPSARAAQPRPAPPPRSAASRPGVSRDRDRGWSARRLAPGALRSSGGRSVKPPGSPAPWSSGDRRPP